MSTPRRDLFFEVIRFKDPDYPLLLREIYAPPPSLMIAGDFRSALSQPCIAIVGSRKASERGCHTAYTLAWELSKLGITIVSGMAFGIDAAAHEGALDGGGRTVAVWATGLDRVYPRAHAKLAKRIETSGAIISEFPLGTLPELYHFPRRNRIISGLSLAVVIVEAAARSGSLITARLALEQGRDVFAVPGPPHHLQHEGTQRLLDEGASPIESANDIIELIWT